VADLPIDLDPQSSLRLAAALDVEGKLPRALEALGPLAGRDVVLVGGGEAERRRLEEAKARLTLVEPLASASSPRWPLPDASADAVLAAWSAFRAAAPAEVAEADRVLRPGGRLLVVHDYGRDDVSRVRGERPEYGDWSRRDGPFLSAGFRIHVVHCFWTFASLEETASFLDAAFGDAGRSIAAGLKRPRLSWNVAIYHRTRPAT
jgi:SAM-dependent methyltransferase